MTGTLAEAWAGAFSEDPDRAVALALSTYPPEVVRAARGW